MLMKTQSSWSKSCWCCVNPEVNKNLLGVCGGTASMVSACAAEKPTVLLQSDGCAVSCGWNECGGCEHFPRLDAAVTQVSAARFAQTVLLRSCAVPSKSWRVWGCLGGLGSL